MEALYTLNSPPVVSLKMGWQGFGALRLRGSRHHDEEGIMRGYYSVGAGPRYADWGSL